jgi:hypothetical protein
MAVTDWNWRLPTDVQDYPWDCAAAASAWAMRAAGFPYTEQDVIEGLGPQRISPTLGLLDASGAGLVTYFGECGIGAENNPVASWSDVLAAAGHQPMVIGGRNWCHWTAVRMGTWAVGIINLDMIALMNPAPGYMGVNQTLDNVQFAELGPFSAVWFTSW